MIRRFLVSTKLILISGIILFCLCFLCGIGSADIITVDDDGGADYEKIQDAVDVAEDGDTIRVFEGTYYENVIVDKSVSLIGNGSVKTTIDGDGKGTVVKITVDWVNMSGFMVMGSGGSSFSGIKVESDHNHIFENNCSNNNYGIYHEYSSYNNLTNNTYSSNNLHGIWFRESDHNKLTKNTCISNNDFGISLSSSSNNTITNNTCENNYYGIYLSSSSNCTITNNTCSNNYDGIFLSSSSDCTIENNTCSSNNNDGIRLSFSSDCTITNNTMNENGISIYGSPENWTSHTMGTSNTVNGKPVYYYKNVTGFTVPYGAGQVVLANCSWITVENQNCSNGSVGIMVGYSSNITLMNNICSANNAHGIQLYRSSNCTITNNTCSSNNDNGIYLWDSNACTITNNTCSSNNDHGIVISTSNDCTIENNTYSSNNGNGIYLISSSDCTIENNTCSSNNNDGIRLSFSSDCTITNNTMNENGISIYGSPENWTSHTMGTSNTVNGKPVYYYKNVTGFTVPYGAGQVVLANCSWITVENQNCSNGSVGIMVGYSSNITLMNNICSANNAHGIQLYRSSNCTITNNTCSSNNDNGIYLWDSNACTITNNTCSSNNNDGIHLLLSWYCTITNNTISENVVGIYLRASSRDNTAHYNNIYNNTDCGINANYNEGYKVDATHNWWGDNSGPYHLEDNPEGEGDNITDYVLFDPWLDENGNIYEKDKNGDEEDNDNNMWVLFILIFILIILLALLSTVIVFLLRDQKLRDDLKS